MTTPQQLRNECEDCRHVRYDVLGRFKTGDEPFLVCHVRIGYCEILNPHGECQEFEKKTLDSVGNV